LDNELWRNLPGGEQISRDGNAKNGIKHDVLRAKWDELRATGSKIAAEETGVRDSRIDSSVPESIIKPKSRKAGKSK
jgi:hypothetical protein